MRLAEYGGPTERYKMQAGKAPHAEARIATSVWRNRDFRLIWGGQTASDFGTGLTMLAYPLLMLALTHSPTQAGALSAVCTLPYLLLGLPAGALADRWNRKRVMIICDLCRAVTVFSIPLTLWLGHVTPVQLYVTGFLGGVFFVFFSAADAGALPNVVEKDQLTSAVAAQQATSSATAVVAPPLGGSLFQIFRGLPFLIDAISYLASAIVLSAARLEFQQPREQTQTKLRSDIVVGVRWLWTHPAIRTVAIAAAGLQLAMAGAELVVIIAAQREDASPAVIGAMLSAVGIGGVAGSILASRLKARFEFGHILLSVMWCQAALWVLIGLFAHVVLLIAPLLVVFVATAQIFGIAALSYQLSATPDHLQSRVGTAFKLIAWSSFPLGAGIAGVLLGRFGPAVTSLVFGVWVFAIALFATVCGGLRELADPSDHSS
ncbi:MFS transporter [Nocardioides sp. InS609-2]|uniref:MFS transporter n=1 Tax=Nocardioides sp. InS609-2 TaxID=2760705 RepID=UPI0020C0FD6C|nr:MFS transporter [Nocardioides sp. InS609-2]